MATLPKIELLYIQACNLHLRLYAAYPVVEMKYNKREEGYSALGAYIVSSQSACNSKMDALMWGDVVSGTTTFHRMAIMSMAQDLHLGNPSSCDTIPQ